MNEQRKLYADVLRRGRNIIGKYRPTKFNIIDLMIILSIICLVAVILFCPKEAKAFSDDQAVRVIVGEAADQGLTGMTMVGETIRRRGSIRGCYGINAAHNNTEPAWVWRHARMAWAESASTHLTADAIGWGSIEDFKIKKWAKGKKIVCRYRRQLFYRKD